MSIEQNGKNCFYLKTKYYGLVDINPIERMNDYSRSSETYHGFEIQKDQLDFVYSQNTKITITAKPDFGFRFSHWVITYNNKSVKKVSKSIFDFYSENIHCIEPIFKPVAIYAINCGSTDNYINKKDGLEFSQDNYFEEGSSILVSSQEDDLLNKGRTGRFKYKFPELEEGDYYISLTFANIGTIDDTLNVEVGRIKVINDLNLKNAANNSGIYSSSFFIHKKSDITRDLIISINQNSNEHAALLSITIQDACCLENKIESIVSSVIKLPDEQRLKFLTAQLISGHVDYVGSEDFNSNYPGIVWNGGGDPSLLKVNSAYGWASMIDSIQERVLGDSCLELPPIPIIYSADAVHGFGHLKTAIIFPHNIGLGCANNVELMEEIGKVTALECSNCGISTTFAPCLAVAKELRWGRVYESYGECQELVGKLGAALIRGLQGGSHLSGLSNKTTIAATGKHFIADGGTKFGSGWSVTTGERQFNELEPVSFVNPGENTDSIADLEDVHIKPYKRAIESGLSIIMPSYSTTDAFGKGISCHHNKVLLTNILRNELLFKGFVTSDQDGTAKIYDKNFTDGSWGQYNKKNIARSLNAGVDTTLVSDEDDLLTWNNYQSQLIDALESGIISESDLIYSFKNILRVKCLLNLFDNPYILKTHWMDLSTDTELRNSFKKTAKKAVKESMVLLKNESSSLPLKKEERIGLVGKWADDIGILSGGWTIEWLGDEGNIYPEGRTIKSGFELNNHNFIYEAEGYSDNKGELLTSGQLQNLKENADKIVIVIGEYPTAEEFGDRMDLDILNYKYKGWLSEATDDIGYGLRKETKHMNLLEQVYENFGSVAPLEDRKPIICILVTGRPIYIGSSINDLSHLTGKCDSIVSAWFPGSECDGIVELLYGDGCNFNGKLSFSWPNNREGRNKKKEDILYSTGYGLLY